MNFDIRHNCSNSINIVLEHLNFTKLADDGYYFVCSLHAPTCNYVNWYWTDYFYFLLYRWFFVHIKLCCFYRTFKVGVLNHHLYTPCDLRYYKLSITEKRCTQEDSLSYVHAYKCSFPWHVESKREPLNSFVRNYH